MAWAVPNGPLTIENPEGTIHLALFETESDSKSISAVAFGASGEEFLVWKDKLENYGLELRITDHKLAYSLYFRDPWENLFEITTYEHDFVREQRPDKNFRLNCRLEVESVNFLMQ